MATYYVATTGNNNNDGLSPGTAWLTLEKAETSASNSDIVNVGAGTFQATTYFTFAKAITWVGAGSSNTILRGNNSARVIYLNSTSTKTFTGFGIDGLSSGTVPAYHIEGSGVDQATTFSQCDFTNAKTTTLRMNSGMKGVTIEDFACTIGATQTAFVQEIGGASGWIIRNGTITAGTGLAMSALFYQATAVTSGAFVIDNVNMTLLSNYAPFRLFAGGFSDCAVTDCTITVGSNNTRKIVEIKDIIGTFDFSRNTITCPSTSTATTPFGIWSTVDTGPDCIVTCEDNIVYTYNADSYGFLIGDEGGDINSEAGAFNGSSVRRNRLYFAPYFGYAIGQAHGIMMGGNTNIFFEDNYLYGAAYCAACKGHSEAWTDGYIQNNIFEHCTYSVRMKGQSSIRCVNNVIYNSGGMAGTSLSVTENGAGEDSDNAFLRNNLCIRDADKVYEFVDTSYDTADLDYQGVYLTGTATMGSNIAGAYPTLADWQAANGNELNAISGDPKIKADFTIGADSPFFEKGIPVTGVTHIYDTTKTYEITLAGAAAFSLDTPYKNRRPIT